MRLSQSQHGCGQFCHDWEAPLAHCYAPNEKEKVVWILWSQCLQSLNTLKIKLTISIDDQLECMQQENFNLHGGHCPATECCWIREANRVNQSIFDRIYIVSATRRRSANVFLPRRPSILPTHGKCKLPFSREPIWYIPEEDNWRRENSKHLGRLVHSKFIKVSNTLPTPTVLSPICSLPAHKHAVKAPKTFLRMCI